MPHGRSKTMVSQAVSFRWGCREKRKRLGRQLESRDARLISPPPKAVQSQPYAQRLGQGMAPECKHVTESNLLAVTFEALAA